MNDWLPPDFVGQYVGSNVIAIALLLAAFRWPQVVRWAFVVVFAGGAIANAVMVTLDPQLYVEGYAALAWPLYRGFIEGTFSRFPVPMVLAIAAGQGLVALLLARSRRLRWLGVAGGVVFLLAVAPLGVGSGFPATVVMALALITAGRRLTYRPLSAAAAQ